MAKFITARLQSAVTYNAAVKGEVTTPAEDTSVNRRNAIHRGDFVVFTPSNGVNPNSIEKATAAQVTSKAATHIVALTDMTVGGGHVPTENQDYRPTELVAATTNSPISGSSPVKTIGLYPILDWNDIIPDADKNDTKA